MRRWKTGLFVFAVASVAAAQLMTGCSADGGGEIPTTNDDSGASSSSSSGLTTSSSSSSSASSSGSSGKTDAGKDGSSDAKADAVVDAGPPPPVPGAACTDVGKIVAKTCGFCGTQETVCEGTNKWSDYGPCLGEVAGGCAPGSVGNEDCGNCGKRNWICQNNCSKAFAACAEPAGACKPGTVEYTQAGCSAPDTYKDRTCDATCKYGAFSATCQLPNNANKLTISGTVGGVVSGQYNMPAGTTMSNVLGDCPGADVDPLERVSFFYVEIYNDTAQTAVVQLYNSVAPGGDELDTVIWTYNGALPPVTDVQLAACQYGVEDSCGIKASGATGGNLADNICGNTDTNLDMAAVDNVNIAPGKRILAYVSGYQAGINGPIMLNVRTKSLM